MRCPTLAELPPPPPDKTGWPWTEETPSLPETMPDGSPWPRISIVTPSYNQGQFIEETIRSVLLQGYPNLEYIIIDGGSTDNSVEIIKKYESWLAYWVSEKDRGQSHAINKGFERSTGEIVAWLNSDDVYNKNAILEAIYILFEQDDITVVYGESVFIDEDSKPIGKYLSETFSLPMFLYHNMIPQPSSFVRRTAIDTDYLVDENYFFVMDYELWLRIGISRKIEYQNHVWSFFRIHNKSKSVNHEVIRWKETLELLKKWFISSARLEGIQSEYANYIGHSFWRLSLAYCDANQWEEASQYVKEALILAPGWLTKREFQNIVITFALKADAPEDWVIHFFSLVPLPSLHLFWARRTCLAWLSAKQALTANSSRDAEKYIWRAVYLDPRWLLDRNLMYKLLLSICGEKIAEIIHGLLGRRSVL